MKHIPTFKSFLNEAKVKIKDPRKVKIGDTAIDGNGKKGKVIAIGKIGDEWPDMQQFANKSDVPELISNAPSGAKSFLNDITIVAAN